MTTEPRTFVIEFPPGMELLTANSRLSRYPRARLIKSLRGIGWGHAKKCRVPQLGPATVEVFYHPPAGRGPLCSARIHDADNIAPTAKALIDGIAQSGVWPRDSAQHVRRVSYEFGPKSKRGQVVMRITEVATSAARGQR